VTKILLKHEAGSYDCLTLGSPGDEEEGALDFTTQPVFAEIKELLLQPWQRFGQP